MARKPKEPASADMLIQRIRDTADAFGWVVTSHQVDENGQVIVTLHVPQPPSDEAQS